MCSKPTKFNVDGKDYCAIHNPDAVAARRQKSDARWHAQLARESASRRLTAAAPDLLSIAKRWAVAGILEWGDSDLMTQTRAAIAKATKPITEDKP